MLWKKSNDGDRARSKERVQLSREGVTVAARALTHGKVLGTLVVARCGDSFGGRHPGRGSGAHPSRGGQFSLARSNARSFVDRVFGDGMPPVRRVEVAWVEETTLDARAAAGVGAARDRRPSLDVGFGQRIESQRGTRVLVFENRICVGCSVWPSRASEPFCRSHVVRQRGSRLGNSGPYR